MDARLGLKVKFNDPANPANIIVSQFATIRGHGEMKTLMDNCARLEVAETVALRKYSLAAAALDDAGNAEALEAAAKEMEHCNEERMKAGNDLLEGIHRFIVRGFELAGATPEKAEELSCLVGPEQLADLKVKCAFGAGVVDFTKAEGL